MKNVFRAVPQINDSSRYGAALLLIAGVWLIVRPYLGIRHDSVLYTAQALARIHPEVFASDIFFLYGAQDQFTIFPWLMSFLFRHVSVGDGAVVILLFSLTLLWLAIETLFRQILPVTDRVLGFAVLAAVPHLYGAQQLFAFAEPFLTARSLAEPLVLYGLALYVRDRKVFSFFLMLVAAAVHPIISLPGIAVIWLCEVQKDWRKSLLIIPAATLAVIAGYWDISPFDRLLTTFDDDWKAVIGLAIVFVRNWDWTDWNIVLVDSVFLGLCIRHAAPEMRRILVAVLAVALGGLFVALVAADGLSNLLITQLQLWRGLWLSHLFALMLLPWLGRNLIFEKRELVLLLLGTALVGIKHEAAVPVLALALLVDRSEVVRGLLRDKYGWAVKIVCIALLARASVATSDALLDAIRSNSVDGLRSVLMFVSVPLVAIFFLWVSLRLTAMAKPTAAYILALAVFLVGILSWDKRSDWQEYVEHLKDSPHPFTQRIAPSAQVYWEEGLEETWFLLRRPSFYSDNQGSGIVFNKGTAIEYAQRRKLFEGLRFAKDICMVSGTLNNIPDKCTPDKELIHDLCVAAPNLSYIVMSDNIGGWAELSWSFPETGDSRITYYLHDCVFIRQQKIEPPVSRKFPVS